MQKQGLLLAAGAYVLWGMLPLYWKLLRDVPTLQLLGHRIVWSLVALLLFTLSARQMQTFIQSAFNPKVLFIYLIAALLVGLNWGVYVWSVNAGHIVETSLGYFINPLISVLLGVFFLKERLRIGQWIPIGLTAMAVIYLSFAFGRLPWIALTLAFSFALYALVKKVAPLSALNGLLLETVILIIPAASYLFIVNNNATGVFAHQGITTDLLLAGAGIATTVPLLMFASAARRIPLSLVGILQYISPTIQFMIGVFVYREPFTGTQLIVFSIVWFSLLIFAFESALHYKRSQKAY
jgi:chloramphenicol-sensitive protein RarD